MKSGKSSGIDGILNEFLIHYKDIFLPILEKLFNVILHTGYFPESWTKSVIVPVFKKGDIHDVSNYRGISLVSHVAKFFTTIVNTRLLKWSEEYNIITDTIMYNKCSQAIY